MTRRVRPIAAAGLLLGAATACGAAGCGSGAGTPGVAAGRAEAARLAPQDVSPRSAEHVGAGAGVDASAAAGPAGGDTVGGFARASGTRAWRFPRDHGSHPAYETEWWYVTGIVRDGSGRRFGYQVTFFRVGLPGAGSSGSADAGAAREADSSAASAQPPRPTSPWRARDLIVAHAAITDVERRRLLFADRADRAALGFAVADTADLDVGVGTWRFRRRDGSMLVRVPPGPEGIGLELALRPLRPPVLHGEGGLAAKGAGPGAGASWYVSLPRLATDGVLEIAGAAHRVSGTSWMDHEFFTGGLAAGQEGWDWLSLRLEDGRDVMLYRLRRGGERTDYALGTVAGAEGAEGRPLDLSGAVFEPLERWRSPDTGALYPVAWRVALPGEELSLEIRTPVASQEVPSRASVGFAYWEGLVDASGTWRGDAVRGEGYLEMTGYDRPLRLP
ncbi:MAG TPA: lipocalin-like domain-containing protein [Gemmatimonadota bacterium]